MKTRRRWWLRAALLTLAGCDDFTLVEPEPQEPVLSIHLTAAVDESARYELNAVFLVGTDARGQPTELVDRALYVEGTPVLPVAATTPGIWSYRWQETRVTPGADADSVRVVLPVIATAPRVHSITVPVTSRIGPADVSVTRGEDLLLRVASADGATSPFGGVEFWSLELRQSCSSGDAAPQFTIHASGPHPTELRIPWPWLEPLPVGSMAACFHAFSSFHVVGSPYPASVGVSARVTWRIQVLEP